MTRSWYFLFFYHITAVKRNLERMMRQIKCEPNIKFIIIKEFLSIP
jgi:hypothetical protein